MGKEFWGWGGGQNLILSSVRGFEKGLAGGGW